MSMKIVRREDHVEIIAPSPELRGVRSVAPPTPSGIPFFLLLTLLVFAPLAFGAVELWARTLLLVGSALVFALLALEFYRRPEGASALNSAPVWLALGFFAYTAALTLIGKTAYREESLSTLENVFCYLAAFLCAAFFMSDRKRRKQFVWLAIIFGAGLALFGIAQHLTGNGKLYWVRQPAEAVHIFGPYASRNNFAGMIELLLPFAVVAASSRRLEDWRRALCAFAALLMAASIILSTSRGGMLSMTAELILLGTVIGMSQRKWTSALPVIGVAVAAVIAVVLIGSAQVTDRLQYLGDPWRVMIFKDSLAIIRDFPLFGTGLGTFPLVYPQYRSFSTNIFVNEAHNDVLQLTVELGIIGLGLVLAFLAVLFRKSFTRALGWNEHFGGITSLAALGGIAAILVHSFVDFNLQIPANAFWFCTLCGVLAAHGSAEEPR